MDQFDKWLSAQTVTLAPAGEPFTLASGRESPYYLNLKSVLMHWRFIRTIGHRLAVMARMKGYDLIAGMETAAIPLITMTVSQDYDGASMHGFYLRKEVKKHGVQRLIEYSGNLQGQRVLLIEDVVTSGGSLIEAVKLLREAGAIVEEAICIVDREEGGSEALADSGVSLIALYRGSDLHALV